MGRRDGIGNVFERLPLPNGNPTWPMPVGRSHLLLWRTTKASETFTRARSMVGDVTRHTHEGGVLRALPVYRRRADRLFCRRRNRVPRCGDQRSTRIFRFRTPSTAPQTIRRFEQASESLEHFAPHPDGTRLAFVSRGQGVCDAALRGRGDALRHGQPARTRLAQWLHDGKEFAGVTDTNGYEQIAVWDRRQRSQPRTRSRDRRYRARHRTGSFAGRPTSSRSPTIATNCACSTRGRQGARARHLPGASDLGHRILARRPIHRVRLVAGARNLDRAHR